MRRIQQRVDGPEVVVIGSYCGGAPPKGYMIAVSPGMGTRMEPHRLPKSGPATRYDFYKSLGYYTADDNVAEFVSDHMKAIPLWAQFDDGVPAPPAGRPRRVYVYGTLSYGGARGYGPENTYAGQVQIYGYRPLQDDANPLPERKGIVEREEDKDVSVHVPHLEETRADDTPPTTEAPATTLRGRPRDAQAQI